MRLRALLGVLIGFILAGGAAAAGFKPAIVFDQGGRSDRSFNAAVWKGAERFTGETGVAVLAEEAASQADRAPAMRRAIARGATLVIGVGFSHAEAIAAVAAENPGRSFAIIDVNWLDLPNLRQYAFKEHEGSYLVGVAAALTSKTGTLGFVGGMDVPLIRRVRLRLRPGRGGGEAGHPGPPGHDGKDARRVEPPGKGRGAGARPVRAGRRRGVPSPPAAPGSA